MTEAAVHAGAQPWIREGDNYRCTRHRLTFPRGIYDVVLEGKTVERSGCPKCDTDPAPAPDAREAKVELVAPKGCLTSEQLERTMVVDLTLLRRLRNGLARRPGKTPREYNAIAKLADSTTKLQRALLEAALRREDGVVVDARERRWSERGGRRPGANH